MLTMIFLKRFFFLFSISFVCGAKDRVKMDTNLPDGSPVIGYPCASNPCLNNGHCTPTSHTNIGYFCQCSISFYGTSCTKSMEDVLLRMFGILIHGLATIHSSNAVALVGPVMFLIKAL